MKEFFQNYQNEIIGGFVGLLIAISIIMIGFIKTIFVAVVVLIGCVVGHYWHKLWNILQKN